MHAGVTGLFYDLVGTGTNTAKWLLNRFTPQKNVSFIYPMAPPVETDDSYGFYTLKKYRLPNGSIVSNEPDNEPIILDGSQDGSISIAHYHMYKYCAYPENYVILPSGTVPPPLLWKGSPKDISNNQKQYIIYPQGTKLTRKHFDAPDGSLLYNEKSRSWTQMRDEIGDVVLSTIAIPYKKDFLLDVEETEQQNESATSFLDDEGMFMMGGGITQNAYVYLERDFHIPIPRGGNKLEKLETHSIIPEGKSISTKAIGTKDCPEFMSTFPPGTFLPPHTDIPMSTIRPANSGIADFNYTH